MFVLCFLVLTLLLRLVTGGIDKVLDLPVLNALNTIGGGALGLIEGALLLFLVCDVATEVMASRPLPTTRARICYRFL